MSDTEAPSSGTQEKVLSNDGGGPDNEDTILFRPTMQPYSTPSMLYGSSYFDPHCATLISLHFVPP